MKKTHKVKNIFLDGLITCMITFSMSTVVIGQDTVKTTSQKSVVRLKINKDENGKTTVIDTTFALTTKCHKELKAYLNKHRDDLDDLGEELENIEVMVDIPDLPDSLMTDSVIKQLRIIGKDFKVPDCLKWHNRSQGYDFEYEDPCTSGISPPFCMPGCKNIERDCCPDNNLRSFQYESKLPTLSDILGDIPMDRVKSYSIKDKKNGKRIIIDLNDGPMIEKQDRVIIIREQGEPSRSKNH
jgi:hypothetical protein